MCGAVAGGPALDGAPAPDAAVIQGTVARAGIPVGGAYVRLLDASGEFTGEVPTSPTGQFRFFAAPGRWTVRTLAPRTPPVDREVVAQGGGVASVDIRLPN